ncbi:MAG TPA: DUF1206 domain-containing protein [Tepidisphaeraceae bacterium]|nr:DUF1206 domain-containing protein [Tepidisphaeraceae bacterium]
MTTAPVQTVRDAPPERDAVLVPVARVGYAARGVSYALVGALAVAAAVTAGREDAPDLKSASRWLLDQPFGAAIVIAIAVGLAAFGTWQLVRGVEDADHDGSDGKALFKRAGFILSGMIQFAIAWGIFRLARGAAGAGGEQSAQDRTAALMAYPLGRWLVAAIGIGIVAYAVSQFVRAYRTDLDDQLDLSRVGATARRWIRTISRFGMAARGVVFTLTGLFLILAAWRSDASEARGLGGALEALERQPYGPWLMGTVALGLVAYGMYLFVLSRYRRIRTD